MTITLTLDDLVDDWRASLEAAGDALRSVESCHSSIPFAPGELSRRAHDLARERAQVSAVIEEAAHDQHVLLRHSLSDPRATNRMLGLPASVSGCIFDLDGVLTASAEIHATAWKETLDAFVLQRADDAGNRFVAEAFNMRDYWEHIHGRPRIEGLRAFLGSRGIVLPEGSPQDPPSFGTVHGLANWKRRSFELHLARDPLTVLRGSQRYLECAREAGLHRVVVSPSANTRSMLELSGLAKLVEGLVDGRTMEHEGLESKPAPDTLLAACALLGLKPEQVAAFETTIVGVEAARAAGVGFVVAVDRHGGETHRRKGADRVVTSLADLIDSRLGD